MKTTKNHILKFIREIAIVVIGVLIAVSINSFKENIDNKRYVEKTLATIEKEIEISKNEIDTTLAKHLTIIDSLEYYFDDNEILLRDLLRNLGGIQSPSVKVISLRFFVANKAELVDFELIAQLSEIEIHSDGLSSKMKRLIDFVYENMNNSSSDAKIKFAFFLANIIDSEQSLIQLYDNFLDENTSFLK